MTTPYAAMPVDSAGARPDRAEMVFGPRLGDGATRAELARRVAVLTVENDRLRAVDIDRTLERLDNECALRIRAERRLLRAAAAFSAIVRRYPETAAIIDAAREDIWGA